MDVERGVQACDLEQPQHGRVGADERHAPALARHAAQPVEQDREAGRVDELHRAQVEHDRGLAATDGVVEQDAEARRGRDVDLAGDRDDVGAFIEVLFGELELRLGERHGRLPIRPQRAESNGTCSGAAGVEAAAAPVQKGQNVGAELGQDVAQRRPPRGPPCDRGPTVRSSPASTRSWR